MGGILARLREVGESALIDRSQGTRPQEEKDPASERPRSGLFQCLACENVYIASEKSRCSQCDVAVKRIQSALTDFKGDQTN